MRGSTHPLVLLFIQTIGFKNFTGAVPQKMDLSYFRDFHEIAVVFAERYKDTVQSIYDRCQELYPAKEIFLVAAKDIICSAKCDAYESYLVVGIACPLHRFKNAAYYTEELSERYLRAVRDHRGPVVFDSVYEGEKYGRLAEDPEAALLVVTEDQRILDYYNHNYDSVKKLPNNLVLRDRMKHLMKENIDGAKVSEKSMFGVVFTSKSFEGIADALHARLNERARAYKIFLKDISYERLISIDHLDCIVLVDCPVFQCNIATHVPIISPFSVQCGLDGVWRGEYSKNSVDGCESRELVVRDLAADLMECREFKGVLYRGDSDGDMEIHEGRVGTASGYDGEAR